MSKKKLKAKTKEKGITLIALVITIIVLLILAGITINSVIGSKGILNNAKKATTAYTNAEAKEKAALILQEYEIQKAAAEAEGKTPESEENFLKRKKDNGDIDGYKTNGDGTPSEITIGGKAVPIKDGKPSDPQKADNGNNTGSSSGESSTLPVLTTTDYTGYYADVNNDGTVDGVIFIDLAHGASGQWGDSNGKYSYSAVTSGLRSYKISTIRSSYTGKFGTKSVVAPNGTSGNSRFYVMALSDYDSSTYTWSDALYKTKTVGSVTFGLPSKMEWAAFGGQLGITNSNHSSTYGLSHWYWSSTEYDSSTAWYAHFGHGCMDYYSKTHSYKVRLCATF